jgi:flagellar basal body-associated protein FliL
MNLTNNQKVLLGIIHFLPVIGFAAYFIYFFLFFFSNIENLENNTGEPSQIIFFKSIIGAFVILIVTLLISIGIKIFDIIHLIKSNKNDKSNKILIWVLLFIFVGVIAEIIYFFLEIIPKKKQELTQQ